MPCMTWTTLLRTHSNPRRKCHADNRSLLASRWCQTLEISQSPNESNTIWLYGTQAKPSLSACRCHVIWWAIEVLTNIILLCSSCNLPYLKQDNQRGQKIYERFIAGNLHRHTITILPAYIWNLMNSKSSALDAWDHPQHLNPLKIEWWHLFTKEEISFALISGICTTRQSMSRAGKCAHDDKIDENRPELSYIVEVVTHQSLVTQNMRIGWWGANFYACHAEANVLRAYHSSSDWKHVPRSKKYCAGDGIISCCRARKNARQ